MADIPMRLRLRAGRRKDIRLNWWCAVMALVTLLSGSCVAAGSADSPDPPLTPPLISLDPANEDYITAAAGGRYFADSSRRPFIPIGYNHNPDWSGLIESNPRCKNYDPKVTAAFFQRLKSSGVNLIRLMLETPGSGLFEDPIGTFDPQHVQWIDNIVRCARDSGVRLMVTPWDTFWMNHRWHISPYSSELGGPVHEKTDFIVKPEVLDAQKKRFAFIIDRWGNSGAIFAWELLNEADVWWGASAKQLGDWTASMAEFVRDYEHRRWGRNHLIALSTAQPMPSGELGQLAFQSPALDLATTHLYIGASREPDEPIKPALAIAEGVRFARAAIVDNRPYLDSENGPINRWIADPDLDDEVFHSMSWAHLASGGAGSGLRWPYRNPHHLSDGMFNTLAAMRRFVDTVPWDSLAGASCAVEAIAEGWVCCSVATRKAALLWLMQRPDAYRDDLKVTLKWPGGPAAAAYRAVDTRTGEQCASSDVMLIGSYAIITLPQPPRSVAVIITATES